MYGSGYSSAYDTINAAYRAPPSAVSLYAAGYRAILTFSDASWHNSTTWGDMLADFVELGGGVVVMVFADQNGIHLQGRWNPRYTLWDVNANSYTSGALGTVYHPMRPIMAGANCRTAATTLKASLFTTRIAEWTSGNLECVTCDSSGIRVVYLGFYPQYMVGTLGEAWIRQINNALQWAGRAAVYDVGCIRGLYLYGTQDSTTVHVPSCSLDSYGNRTEIYTMRMRIGTGYNRTVTVSGHAPAPGFTRPFRQGMPAPRVNAITCSTELAGDTSNANDKAPSPVFITVHDVGAVLILAPTGTVMQGTPN